MSINSRPKYYGKEMEDFYNLLLDKAKSKGYILLTPMAKIDGPKDRIWWICVCGTKVRTNCNSLLNLTNQCGVCFPKNTSRGIWNKKTYDQVVSEYESFNAILLLEEKDFINTRQIAEWLCKRCDRKNKNCISTFLNDKWCKTCDPRGTIKSKPTFEKFVSLLSKEGWCMISSRYDFLDTKSLVKVTDENGKLVQTSYNRFVDGGHRSKFTQDNNFRVEKLQVLDRIIKCGFILVEEFEYTNNTSLIEVICNLCERKYKITYTSLTRKTVHRGCDECSLLLKKWDEIVSCFENENCKLLTCADEYCGNNSRLKYICVCGERGRTSWKLFRNGTRCKKCGISSRKSTNLERYGVENVMHNPEIVERSFKNAYRLKDYTFSDGRTIQYQGYEGKCIDILIKEYHIQPSDVIVGTLQVPVIPYVYKGTNRMYYPDILIKNTNILIEVKSEWTYSSDLECNLAKWKAASQISEYSFEVWVFNKRGILIRIESYYKNLTMYMEI